MKTCFIMLTLAILSRMVTGCYDESYVVFQERKDGGGSTCKDEYVGKVNMNHGCVENVGNDKISHVQVCGDRCVQMWGDSDWRGMSWIVCNTNSSDGCTSKDAGNGKVSSYEITGRDCSLELCEHAHTTGKCCTKDQWGSYNSDTFGGSCPADNSVSKITIKGSCMIRLYEHDDFQGESVDFKGPGSWNLGGFINDAISSFKFGPKITDKCSVELCEHSHKDGKCCTKDQWGWYNSDTFGGSCPPHDSLSMITIEGTCMIRLYEHVDFKGVSWDLKGPGSWSYGDDFKNDAVSSFIFTSYMIAKECSVKLCDHSHIAGKCCTIDQWGWYNSDIFKGSCPADNSLSMITIDGACTIRLYEDDNFKGHSWDLKGPGSWNLANLGSSNFFTRHFRNDAVSSFIFGWVPARRMEVDNNKTNVTISAIN